MSFRPFILLLAVLLPATAVRAGELLPPSTPIEVAIDHYIDAKLASASIVPAPQSNDATLLRRLMLDLCGRIPTVAETRDYVESKDPAKRVKLVERLMASPSFIRQQATEFDMMLMQGANGSIRPYLQTALSENRSWDRIFRDLVLPAQTAPLTAKGGKRNAGAGAEIEFLRSRIKDIDKLTTEVSVVFFGVNVSCARCHDHPLVPDWKQDHFFGMKSFFGGTFESAGFLGEREMGLVKFQTTKGQTKQAHMMFLTGQVINAPGMQEISKAEEKKEKDAIAKAKKTKTPPAAPSFPRSKLVEIALQRENRDYFARSIVNRLWARFYGYGLVNPVDQMHSENPPNHPELLQWLARDTAEHGYDLRRLTRGLVLSKAYSRSSRWQGPGDPPLAKRFAVARLKPLTPYQMAMSLRIATSNPAEFEKLSFDEIEKKIAAMDGGARGMASWFEYPGDDFQVGVSEALLFSNGERIEKDLLNDSADRLLGRLKQFQDRKQQIQLAVRAALGHEATAEETGALGEFLAKWADRPNEALRQMVWAILTSSEFRFNY